jgi:hypothetical protein
MPLSSVMRGYTRTVYARSSAFAPVVSIMNACAIVSTIFEMPKPLRTSVVGTERTCRPSIAAAGRDEIRVWWIAASEPEGLQDSSRLSADQNGDAQHVRTWHRTDLPVLLRDVC